MRCCGRAGPHIDTESLVPVQSVTLSLETVSGRENQQITVSCEAAGGPPTPHISWTLPHNIHHQVTNFTSVLEDESLQTVSQVTFTPSYDEDLEVIQCHGINDVMTEPITADAVLDIECKCRSQKVVILRLLTQTSPVLQYHRRTSLCWRGRRRPSSAG